MAVGFGGSVKLTGESEYRKALSQITQSLRVVSSEMKSVSSAYGTNDADTKALANQSKQLTTALDQQKTALQGLKSELAKMEAEYEKNGKAHKDLVAEYDREKAKLIEIESTMGKSSKEYKDQQKVVSELEGKVQSSAKAYDSQTKAVNNMRIQTANAETTVNNTAKALDKLGNETEDAAKAADHAGEGFTVFKGVIANLASQAISKAIEGVKRLGSAIVDVGKQAVGSQAEYEQLVGGVETLFKNSAKEVQHYADIAYKTAGMSANQYMETVTSFSASLLQGLNGDTAKAAKIADMAIIDMSDNANKMGTSMEMIQNAYQGFAKDNYTMLDNLKLGYGGTQEEAARLINDTKVMGEAFKATAKNVKDVPFDKFLEAIHKVQENMGITGTTAKEASDTISGSVASMKSAWQNLLTGIANSQLDRKKLVKNFTDSIKTAAKNLIPTVKETIKGLVETAEQLLNTLMGEDMFHFDGDAFVRGIEDAIKRVVQVFKWFVDNRDIVIAAIKGILAAFVAAKVATFVTNIMGAVSALKTMITAAEGVSGAMKILNGTLAANPFALIAGLVVGVGTALVTMASNSEKAKDKLDTLTEGVQNSKKTWEELSKAKQEALDEGMTELNYYDDLARELRIITDENGNVKEGYEKRATFITSTLQDALGIEIKNNGNVIDSYKDVMDAIDKLMEKKKAEILLEAGRPSYEEAIQKQEEGYRRLNELEEERTAKTQEWYDAMQEYQESLNSFNIFWQSAAQSRYSTAMEELNQARESYDEQANLLKGYAFTVQTYEENMANFHAGQYDKMQNVTWDYVEQFQSAADMQAAIYDDQIKTIESALDYNKKQYEKTGQEIYNTEAKRLENQLANTKEKLAAYNTTTVNELKDNGKAWLENATTVLSKLSDKDIEFKDVGEGMVQMFVDGVEEGEPMAKEQAEAVTQSVLGELDAQVEAEGYGKNVVTGFTRGEGNLSLQNAAFRVARTFCGSIINTFKSALGIGSPSKITKSYGKWLLKGLGLGMEDEEDAILKQAEEFGDNVIDALNGSLSDGVSFNALDGIKASLPSNLGIKTSLTGTSDMARASELEQISLVNSFKEALSQMKIEMDDREMATFVDKTVTRLVYN